ncbi:MAG TPA: phosphoglycerate dehydrogenase [Ktedonobacterales bacterium]
MTQQEPLLPRVLVADRIAREGIEYLQGQMQVDERVGLRPEQLQAILGDYTALVVRSETKVTAPIIAAGKNLRVIARAGVGVDNIDLDAATRAGILVVNSPTGNIVAAAEHAIAMLLAMSRHIPAANAALKDGRWERSRYLGVEVRHKTLGIVGLGKVGAEVARRAKGLEMRVVATDPFASPDLARSLGVELLSMEELLPQSDFITLHTSLNTSTKGLIGERELALMKPQARIVNCARGGIVDEAALLTALKENQLAGAALDVFSSEPPANDRVLLELVQHPRVVVTPHLGASTEEAQVMVALDVAEQVVSVLNGGLARGAVNAPLILPETLQALQPYLALIEKMGKLYTQLHPGPLRHVELACSGEIASMDLRPLKVALIKGLLESISDAHVNVVNASLIAKQWGLEVTERTSTEPEHYANLVTLRVRTDGEEHLLAGTITWGEERIVHVDRYATDFAPYGYILICHNMDRPGMIGRVGTILGNAGVNIRDMDVGPQGTERHAQRPRGQALMVLSLDDAVPSWALDQIRESQDIFDLTMAKL